jgi:hypothetical protein
MKVIKAPDTVELTERQVLAALADAVRKETGREMDFITHAEVFDCGAVDRPNQKLLNITVTLKDE